MSYLPLFITLTSLVVCIKVAFYPPSEHSILSFSQTDIPIELKSKIQFVNRASEWNMDIDLSTEFDPALIIDPTQSFHAHSFAILDVDSDDFMDVMMTSGKKVYLFVNLKGKGFRDASLEYGLRKGIFTQSSLFIGWAPIVAADFNQDGKMDIVLATFPRFIMLESNGPQKPFLQKTNIFPAAGFRTESLGVLDFNRDGLLDLVVAPWGSSIEDSQDDLKDQYNIYNTKKDEPNGGRKVILTQSKQGYFTINKKIHFSPRAYSHAIGIIDLDGDGWDDLIFTNDYSSSQIFKNHSGQNVEEIISKTLNPGMGLDVGDLNNDGKTDLLISNVSLPPIRPFSNLIWNNIEKSKFEIRQKTGLEQCGFAFGVKVTDFNNDGKLDVAMANGLKRSINADNFSPSIWFRRAKISQFPDLFNQFKQNYSYPKGEDFQFSAFQRDCVFINHKDHFYDVSESAGIIEKKEGRGLTLVDFDNDGKMDFIVGNSTPDLRHNQSTAGDWIGFSLVSNKGSTIPVGARVWLHLQSGKTRSMQYYPANGYRTQGDPRIHFGLGADKIISLMVQWPDGTRETYLNLKINRYQKITQSKGGKK